MQIQFHRSFKKQLEQLPPQVQRQFSDRLNQFIIAPNHPWLHNHPLRGEYKKYWSINVTGNVRALYTKEDGIIVFRAIGTHSELYS